MPGRLFFVPVLSGSAFHALWGSFPPSHFYSFAVVLVIALQFSVHFSKNVNYSIRTSKFSFLNLLAPSPPAREGILVLNFDVLRV